MINNTTEIQKFIDQYISSNSPDGEVKNFIGNTNFNLDYIYSYLDSLSLLQESALFNICIFISLFLTLINIFAALFANEIINYFDLENKFPKLAFYFKLRTKLQKYYLLWDISIMFLICILGIALNVLTFIYLLISFALPGFSC